ncbi:MAG: ABC transporter substrate-binding protein [Acidobacteriota bacterium]
MLLLWAAVAFSGHLVDQVGHPVQAGPVTRLVALAPDVVELAFALGAGERLVGVAGTADFPVAARSLPRVTVGDVDSIMARRPDLVLATTAGNDPRVIERLRASGVRTFTADVTSCERLAEVLRLLGEVLGARRRGDELADDVLGRCAAAARRAADLPGQGALWVVWWEPPIVAAPNTFHHDLLHRAALTNLAPEGAGRYPRVNPEVFLDPGLRFVVSPDEPDVRAGWERFATSAAGTRLAAGDVQVLWLPADPASRPGPRMPEALEALVAAREARR